MDSPKNQFSEELQSHREPLSVRRVGVEGIHRVLVLSTGTKVALHRFACVGEGDVIKFRGTPETPLLSVICRNGEVPLSPLFQQTFALNGFGGVRVKEIDQEFELTSLGRLTGYHYRNTKSFGRRSVLIAQAEDTPENPIGYIEVTNSFAGHQARNKLLDAPFADEHGIEWGRWDVAAKRKYLNTIARISRCVVHPEYRGIGLGAALCTAAVEYSRSRWQLAGYKALFLEITADMLKFIPFVQGAGLRYIGSTSGNLQRLAKDQTYLASVMKDIEAGEREKGSHSVFSPGAKSILARQKRDVTSIRRLSQAHNVDLLDVLKLYKSATAPEQLSVKAYDLLHEFIRFPKPTFIVGLSPASRAFVLKRIAELDIVDPKEPEADLSVVPIDRPISVNNLTLEYKIAVPKEEWAIALQEAFGLRRDYIQGTGVKNLSFSLPPREILYIWGPSGTGKTILLESLRSHSASGSCSVVAPTANIGTLDFSFSDLPLVLEVGAANVRDALTILNMVGLSEPNLYFNIAAHLSTGQKYRLALAKLIAKRQPIWIIDEFCSVLDDTTARLIAWNVGKLARRVGVTAIIAGPRKELVISSLKPETILELSSLGDWKLIDGKTRPHQRN